MPRKPNYKFERLERQRQKSAKKAARQEAKQGKPEDGNADDNGLPGATEVTPDTPEGNDPDQ
ncbi:MAG: hypothetical protein HQ494_09110 [Rhodospirillales bacterium]|nr:hypothetical protein [Rhodospirillales bacterium]